MDELIRTLIAEKDFSRLEDVWLELMEKPETPLKDFLSIAAGLKNVQAADRAYPLLEILASHFEATGDLRSAIETYKHMTYYTDRHETIRAHLLKLYQKLYQSSAHLDEYLRHAGLAKGEVLAKAIERLEEFLRFDIGRFFYYEHYGVGSVVEVVPAKREIVLHFEKEKRQPMTIDLAKKILTPLSEDHFFYKKATGINLLQERAAADPAGLILLILQSIAAPLTAAQMKSLCAGIVADGEWPTWWDKLKKNLEQNPHIRTGGTSRKTYEYVANAVDRTGEAHLAFDRAGPEEKYRLAEEFAYKQPTVFADILPRLIQLANDRYRDTPGLALDILLLCDDQHRLDAHRLDAAPFSFTVDGLLADFPSEAIITNLQSRQHQIFLLEKIQARSPDGWPIIFKKIFFSLDDAGPLDEILAELRPRPAALKELYQDIFLLARNHPRHYQWLLKKLGQGELVEFLSVPALIRIITNLELIKGTRSMVTQIFEGDTFKTIVRSASADEVPPLLAAVKNSNQLADYLKDDLEKAIARAFPDLFKKDDDVVWTSADGLAHKQEELNHLLQVDIPQNKNDIGRARGFGDLSENYEYKAAKERQRHLQRKVMEISRALEKAKVIDPARIDFGRVSVGTRVTLKNIETGEVSVYTILGRWDIDIEKNIISDQAPVAADVLLGRTVGTTVDINDVRHEIVAIEKAL